MIEDAELLREYAGSRSEQAFVELVRRHLGLVYRVALRKVGGDTHLAEDVAQGVFTDLARKAGALSRREVLAGWLFTSAHFAATKAVRTAIRRRHREQKAQLMHELSSDPTSATDWDRLRPAIDDLIQTLPENDREAVLMRYFEGHDFEQIGTKLHLTPNGARSRVERALDKIRVALARRGITSTAAALAAALEAQGLLAAPAGLASAVTSAALAGAASGSVTAGIGFLMNKTLVASAVAMLAISFAVYQANQIRRVETGLVEISKDRDRLQAQLRDEQRYVAEADRQAATLKRSLNASFSSANSAAAPAQASGIPIGLAGRTSFGPGESPQQAGRITFFGVKGPEDPEEGRRLAREINGRAVDSAYAALYHKLGLTSAQQEQFKTLILDSGENTGALFKAAAAQSPTRDRSAMQGLLDPIRDQAAEQLQASLASAFGTETMQAFQHYQDTMPARTAVATPLASALFYTDTPLTVQQAEQLVDVVANSARNPQGKVDLTVMNSDAMLAQAQGILSEPQLAVLRQLEENRRRLQPAN